MIKLGKKTTATLLTAIIILSIFTVAIPVNALVTVVEVQVSSDPIMAGGTTSIRMGIRTSGAVDLWTGTFTVTDPDGGTSTAVVSGCGGTGALNWYGKIYPTEFTAGATTGIAGTYTISATAAMSGQTPVEETGSFVVIPTGTLSIDTTPMKGEVFVDGGPWGTAPQSHDVVVGTYTVSFGDVAGYTTPSDEEAVVTEDTTTTITGTYVLIQPSSLYPVIVTLSTGETVYIASHTSDPAGGNWIELSGGTSIQLPSPLTIAYEGLDSATYEGDVADVTIESSFAAGEATYPLTTHQVYSTGQSITVEFWGADDMWGPVDFRLISISSIAEARDILTSAFQGDLAPLLSKLTGATWSQLVGLDGVGDATVVIPPQSVGNYLLVVVKQNADDIWIDSATIIEVVEQTLDVTCPSSVQRGASLKVNTGVSGTYIHGAILIKETAYFGEIKLITAGTILSTELRLNGVLMADGTFVTESLSLENALTLLNQLNTAFGSNQMAYGVNLISSLSLSTSSLATGDYVLLVGVYNYADSRIVGVHQKTVTVLKPYVPSPPPPPPPPINRPPVAEAGPNQTVYVGDMTHLSGVGSYDPDGTIVYYKWDLGDGTTASGMNVSHAYSEPGIYTATLTVGDDRMVYGYDTCTITVLETIPLPPSPPILSNLTITPPELERGDNVTISLDIENIDSQSFTYIVTMHIENVNDPPPTWPPYHLTLLVDVELGAYESKTVSRTITMDAVGDFNVTVDGLTGSFKVGTWPPEPPLKPAEFVVSDLSIEPEEIELGEGIDVWTFKITVDVTNIGEQEGSHTVNLRVDDSINEWIASETVTLRGGEQAMIIFNVARSVGSYTVEVDGLTGSLLVKPYLRPLTPAEFEVSDLVLTPSEAQPGATIIVSAKIANIGEMEGNYTLELKLDGETVETESVTLAGGTSQEISFTISSEEEGTHTVEVYELSDSFTIKLPPPKKPIWPLIVIAAAIIAVLIYIIWIKTDWIQQLIKRMGIDGDVQELP